MGYQPTRRPTSIDPPGLFDALLEKITAGEISARDAAVYYISNTVCPAIRPTGEGDLIVMQRRAYLLALVEASEPIDPNKSSYPPWRAIQDGIVTIDEERKALLSSVTPYANHREMGTGPYYTPGMIDPYRPPFPDKPPLNYTVYESPGGDIRTLIGLVKGLFVALKRLVMNSDLVLMHALTHDGMDSAEPPQIAPYTPQGDDNELLFADPEWQARKEEPIL